MKTMVLPIILLCLPSDMGAQQPYSRVYTNEDGIFAPETNGSFYTYDSIYWIVEYDGTISKFDGYKYEHLALYYPSALNTSFNAHHSDSFTIIAGNPDVLYKNNTFYALNRSNNNYYQNRGKHFGYYQDTVYELLPDKKSFEVHHAIDHYFKIQHESIQLYAELPNDRYVMVSNKGLGYFEKKGDSYQQLTDPSLNSDHRLDNKILNGIMPIIKFNYLWLQSHPQKSPYYLNILYNKFDYKIKFLTDSITLIWTGTNQGGDHYLLWNEQTIMNTSHTGTRKINLHIRFFSNTDPNMAKALHTLVEDKAGHIWFGDYLGGWSRWDGHKLLKWPIGLDERILPGATSINGVVYYLTEKLTKKLGKIPFDQKRMPFERKFSILVGYQIKKLPSGKVGISTSDHGLILLANDKMDTLGMEVIGKDKGLNMQFPLCIQEDKKGRIWMIRRGLAVYDPAYKKLAQWEDMDTMAKSKFRGISLCADTYGGLWCGGSSGLSYIKNVSDISLIEKNIFDKATPVILPDGNNSLITALYQLDTFLIAGGQKSLNFISIPSYYRNPKSPLIYQLHFGADIPGQGTEQNAIMVDSKRRLWIGCQTGATVIDWDHFSFDQDKTITKINEIKVGGQLVQLSDQNTITIPKTNRNISLHIGPQKNPTLRKNIYFDYTLINGSGDTIVKKEYDQEAIFSVPSLSQGKYLLTLIARKHGQLMDYKQISISAPRTLEENPWFYMSLFGILSIGIIGFTFYRNKQQNEILQNKAAVDRLQKSLQASQLQTIISSFNPHFINNSLHWASSRYSKDDKFTTLLGNLSENIRYIFKMSKEGKAMHSLAEEMKVVNNYVKIQLIRFANEFKFIGLSDDCLNNYGQILIPLMQIQIHVENAIEHGLSNRLESSLVIVSLSELENNYLITIEDDGCGRAYAKKIKSIGSQSGVNMLEKVHEIYNLKNKNKIFQEYQDNIYGNYGTRVIINVPKTFTYAI